VRQRLVESAQQQFSHGADRAAAARGMGGKFSAAAARAKERLAVAAKPSAPAPADGSASLGGLGGLDSLLGGGGVPGGVSAVSPAMAKLAEQLKSGRRKQPASVAAAEEVRWWVRPPPVL
jgi:hypothetical protein